MRLSITLLSFSPFVALAMETALFSEPYLVVSQELYVTQIPGYYPKSLDAKTPYPDQFYTLQVAVGTPGTYASSVSKCHASESATFLSQHSDRQSCRVP